MTSASPSQEDAGPFPSFLAPPLGAGPGTARTLGGSQRVSEAFCREYGCTREEWLRWMPEAVHGHPWSHPAADSLKVDISQGMLDIDWQELPPRVIALIRLPRMSVSFRFSGVSEDERTAFMKRFDLHLQRGGG